MYFKKIKTWKNFLPIFFIVLYLINFTLTAETIRLMGGQLLEGKILDESEKVIIFQTQKGTFTIKKIDILEMERPDSKDKIAKLPEEKKISITKIILMSFIPGYSPLYHSKEHPEFGIPFAMANLNYFFRFFQFQAGSYGVGLLKSTESKDPFNNLFNLFIGPTFVEPTATALTGTKSLTNNISVYIGMRNLIIGEHRDRVVGGQVYTEDEYLKIKKHHFTNYAGVSVLNAAISLYILRGEGGVGALYNTENNGVKTFFYALPTGDGGIFATISKF